MSQLLQQLNDFSKNELQPLAHKIDHESYYAKDFMHQYGAKKGFAFHGKNEFGGLDLGISQQVQSIATIGRYCGSTAFNAWCQTTCAWYIQNTANKALQKRYLADILAGKKLAGTGLSNTMKSLAGIEKHNLTAVKKGDGFIINGRLPWVTNIGEEHVFAGTAEISKGQYAMFLIEGSQQGVELSDAIRFCALNGTQTLSVQCTDVVIPNVQVLAYPHEFDEYINRIKSGFVSLQFGMALGALLASKDIIDTANKYNPELNALLDYGINDVEDSINYIINELQIIEQTIFDPSNFLNVLKLRLYASEAVLKASQSASLHTGAFGYLEDHHAQRLRREALFVAIITPSMKHLKKAIQTLELQQKKVA
ncbi:MAG: acyl-CoA/acyl-ACP dehydrogenase [Moraxellaceae bacterium]|nr:acyl-CoA/acyl-ACP dehydrogenase [Moraxellaceae bacterium]